MKILIITAVFPPEPVVSSSISYDIATELAVNNEVTVLCPKPTRPYGADYASNIVHENGVSYKRIQLSSFTSPKFNLLGRFRESYSMGRHCHYYIKHNYKNIDILYLNTWPLIGQYFAVRIAKKFKIPVIIHIQDIYPESLIEKLPFFKGLFNSILLPVDKYIQQNVEKVITISPSMKSMLIKTRKLEEEKVEMIYNWQNEDKFLDYRKNTEIDQKRGSFTFMFLGSLNVTAAVHIIIRAFCKAELANARLVIAGNGSEKRRLIALAKTYKDSNIEFWDAPMQKVPALQEKADVLLLNLVKGAAQFALPSKLPAYLFSEKPVIASVDEDSDTSKLILHANCGWVVPPENIDRLAAAMHVAACIASDKLRSYGKNGFNYALKNLSRRTNLQKMTSIIENAMRIKKDRT